MIRLRIVATLLIPNGCLNLLLGAIESSASIWLAIVSIVAGILSVVLGVMATSYLHHIQDHPGVTAEMCNIKHDGLDKLMKLNTMYLKTLIKHSGLEEKIIQEMDSME